MKKFLLGIGLSLSTFALANHEPEQEIKVHTEKVGEVLHWMPEKINVKPGEHVKFVVSHNLKGGFDFHGFNVPVLNIQKQINRGKEVVIETTIPADLKPGEYDIGCQFHPKHAAAKLVVTK